MYKIWTTCDAIQKWHHFSKICWCCCCCCCGAYLSSCHRTASDANLLDDPHTFHYQDYFVIGGIRTCLGVSDDPMFLWISSNSCPLNLLLVRSHRAEIIIVKRLIQGRNSVTRVRVEPRSFDQGRRKNDAFTYSATLPTWCQNDKDINSYGRGVKMIRTSTQKQFFFKIVVNTNRHIDFVFPWLLV